VFETPLAEREVLVEVAQPDREAEGLLAVGARACMVKRSDTGDFGGAWFEGPSL